jgi:hypothetical protein
MEPSGKDGRGGEVSLAAPGHDGMPVRSRPTTALAIWSSVLQPGSLSAGRQQGEHDRRRACRINTRAPRDKQNSRMPRWQARTSGRPIASPIRACATLHARERRWLSPTVVTTHRPSRAAERDSDLSRGWGGMEPSGKEVEAAKPHWRRRDTTACRCGRGRRLPLRSGAASYSLALSAQAGSKANMIDGALVA